MTLGQIELFVSAGHPQEYPSHFIHILRLRDNPVGSSLQCLLEGSGSQRLEGLFRNVLVAVGWED